MEVEKIAKEMWEKDRKITFSECYQTLESIFQYYFQDATKYLKIFSFPKNILHSEKNNVALVY